MTESMTVTTVTNNLNASEGAVTSIMFYSCVDGFADLI